MTNEAEIRDVTETALWVASLRAGESERPDPAFRDPLAALLAGERGAAIARSFPHSALVSWSVVVRTTAIDRLIGEALRSGVDTVLNLGAGLDTRPYRMDLPRELRWIDMDFPGLMAAKDAALRSHAANCRVERIGLDLLDVAARNDVFKSIAATSKSTLLIAEGVIPYWSNEAVTLFAADCRAIPSFRHWILDFDNAGARKTPKSWAGRLAAAPFLFQVDDWFAFFARCGWTPRHIITGGEEALRLRRPYPFAFPLGLIMRALPRDLRRKILDANGAVLLKPESPVPSR